MIDLQTIVEREQDRIVQVNSVSLHGQTANAITIMDTGAVDSWAKAGEIVITSSRMMPASVAGAERLVRELASKRISCLMVKPYDDAAKSNFPKRLIDLGDKLAFPLFKIKSNSTYIQILNEINGLLLQNRRMNKMADLDLDYLLKSNSATDKDFDFVSGLKGVDLYKLQARVTRIAFAKTPNPSERLKVQFDLINQARAWFTTVEREEKILAFFVVEASNGATVISFFNQAQAEKPPHDRKIYHQFINNVHIPHFSVYEGVSATHPSKKLHRAFIEASFGVKIARTLGWAEHPIFYRDVSLWDLVNRITTNQDSRLYPARMDELMENPEIFETVEAFFEQNESFKDTGEVLFTHPNTIRYRLNLIYEQTGLDYRHTNDKFLIYIALIKKLLSDTND